MACSPRQLAPALVADLVALGKELPNRWVLVNNDKNTILDHDADHFLLQNRIKYYWETEFSKDILKVVWLEPNLPRPGCTICYSVQTHPPELCPGVKELAKRVLAQENAQQSQTPVADAPSPSSSVYSSTEESCEYEVFVEEAFRFNPALNDQTGMLKCIDNLITYGALRPASAEYVSKTMLQRKATVDTEVLECGKEDILLVVPKRTPRAVAVEGTSRPLTPRTVNEKLQKIEVVPVQVKNDPRSLRCTVFYKSGFSEHFKQQVRVLYAVPVAPNEDCLMSVHELSGGLADAQLEASLTEVFVETFKAVYMAIKEFPIRDPIQLDHFLKQAAADLMNDLRDRKQRCIYVLSRGGGVLGFLCYKVSDTERTWYLSQLAVSPQLLKVGIGAALMKQLLDRMPSGFVIYGLIRKVNKPALAFYQHVAAKSGVAFSPSKRWCEGYNHEDYDSYECSKA